MNDSLSAEGRQDSLWEWYPCVFDLKKVLKNKEVFYNLAPSIVLKHPNSTEEKPLDLIVNCKVFLEKPFIFSEEMGWNWHKSWNIPNIHAKIEILDPVTKEKYMTPNKFFAEVIVTKAEFSEIQTFHLMDVGIKGNNKYQLHSNECMFSGLKFIPTSYNHEGSKFHLVVIFYLLKNNDDFHHILEAKISPPIFVDSRKTARENHKNLKIKEIYSFIEPFNPDKLKKIFIKRENKKNFGFEEEIENSLHGLTHYFSAPNIRNKVKHPLFLAIKFSKIVNLYYNSKILGTERDEKFIIQQLQKHLVEIYLSGSGKKSILKDKLLLLHVEDIYKGNYAENKKTLDFFDLIETDCLQVISDHTNIPSHFIKLDVSDSLILAYEKIYPKLISDKQLKGTFELLNSKYSSKDSVDNEEDEDSEEEKKDSARTESDDTLIKMDEDGVNLSELKKTKKKVKIYKETGGDIQQSNLAGPIKVEIDLTAEMAKRLNNTALPQKIKLESKSDNIPTPLQQLPPPNQPSNTSNVTQQQNVKVESGTIQQQLPQTKTEEITQMAIANDIQAQPMNPNIQNALLSSFMANNGLAAMGTQGMSNNNMGNMTAALGNKDFNPGIMGNAALANNNNFAMFQSMQKSMQERFLKSMQFYMNPQMNFFNMIENPFANPYIYQEYLKTYMENMKKTFENNSNNNNFKK